MPTVVYSKCSMEYLYGRRHVSGWPGGARSNSSGVRFSDCFRSSSHRPGRAWADGSINSCGVGVSVAARGLGGKLWPSGGVNGVRLPQAESVRAANRTEHLRIALSSHSEFGPRGLDPFIDAVGGGAAVAFPRSEEHTSELQSLMRNSYAVFCSKKKN